MPSNPASIISIVFLDLFSIYSPFKTFVLQNEDTIHPNIYGDFNFTMVMASIYNLPRDVP